MDFSYYWKLRKFKHRILSNKLQGTNTGTADLKRDSILFQFIKNIMEFPTNRKVRNH